MNCKCGEETTGWITVKCCNICGLPIPDETWNFECGEQNPVQPDVSLRIEGLIEKYNFEITELNKNEYIYASQREYGVADMVRTKAIKLEEIIIDLKELIGAEQSN